MMEASTIYQTHSLGCPQGHLQPWLKPVHPQQVCHSTGKELSETRLVLSLESLGACSVCPEATLCIKEVHPWLAYAVSRKSSDVSLLRADKDEDDVAAYEQQMWGKVKLPIWGPQDASPFAPADTVSTSQVYPDDSQQVITRFVLAQEQKESS